MAEAMRDEVPAGTANPAEEAPADPAGAHTEDTAAGEKPAAAGHGQQAPTVSDAGEAGAEAPQEAKPPRPDEVRRSAERAPQSEGQTGSAAKKDQGTSLHGGKADPRGEEAATGTTTVADAEGTADGKTKAAPAKETVVPDRQAVSEVHSDKKVSPAADSVPSGNEEQDEPLSYEPFWRATERAGSPSEKPEIPRRKKRKGDRSSATFQKQPTILEQAAEDSNAQETVDSTVAESHVSVKSPDLGTTTKTRSTLSLKGQTREERLAEEQDVAATSVDVELPDTRECIVTKEQQSVAVESTAIESTNEDDRATPIGSRGHETKTVEGEATTKRDTREITASKPMLTSDTSLSNCTQPRGTVHTESTDEKPDTEKKSSTDRGETSKISSEVDETVGHLSSDSMKAISITLRPETGGRELEAMNESSEAMLKVIPLSESLSDKKSTNKAKEVTEAKETSKIFQPGVANEVIELSAGVQEGTTGILPEGSEVGQVSVDSKMETTTADNEASKTKTPTSKKSKKQKSSTESTNTNNADQKPTEETPLSEIVRQDDSSAEQTPTKIPEPTKAKDQMQRKQSYRKPTKETKKDPLQKQEPVSEPPEVKTGVTEGDQVTVGDLHMSKTATETSATVAKEGASSEKPTLSKTALTQKSASKDAKRQPRRRKSATQASVINKPTAPIAEIAVETSTTGPTDRDESGRLPTSECVEVSSKGALVDEMNTKAQSQKTTGPQKPSGKNTKKAVSKTGSTNKLASGPQKTEDNVAPVTGSSTTKFPTCAESASVAIKKDVPKTESDNAKRNQKHNVKATKIQQGKGKGVVATTKNTNKTQQQAETITDENSTVSVTEDTAEVKTVAETENNSKLVKTYPGRKLNNKPTKTTAKKSNQPPAGDSQKESSSQEASLRTECDAGVSAASNENVSSSKTLSDQNKSNTKMEKDQMKPADNLSKAEIKTVKATVSNKNETLPSGSIQTVEPLPQSSEGDPHSSNEEAQKTTKLTQRKPEKRNAPVRENKRKPTVQSNEKQSAAAGQKETSGDDSEAKSTDMQESCTKAENTKRNAQNSDFRHSDRNRNRNMVTVIVNRVEIETEHGMSDCPVALTETSPESTINVESSTVHAAADTNEQHLPTTVAEKDVSVTSPRKKSSSQKKARKEKAALKKLEEEATDSEKEPPIISKEISTTNPHQVTDSIQTKGTDSQLESTVLAARNVGAKTRLSKSPSDLKPKRKVANPQLKKSSSLVAISKSESKTVLVDGVKVPSSGDTELSKAKTVSLKKSESFDAISTDDKKRQSMENRGRLRIWSLKQPKTCREQGKMQTSPPRGKNTKDKDSVQDLQHPNSKDLTKEGKTESDAPVVFEAPESALKNARKRDENKQLATINSDEADASGKSPRKTKADRNTKLEETIQNTGTGDVDRPAKNQSKVPQEKSVESAELARQPPGGKPASPRLRRQKLTQSKEDTKATLETKLPDAGEDTPETIKDTAEEKPHAARKGENVPASGLPKHGNSPRKRTDEDTVAEPKQKTSCLKHETRTNGKLQNVDSTQKKAGQTKHESVPTTVTITLKAGDNKGTVNKSAGDTVKLGETVECTISTSVAKKKEQRSFKPREQTEQTLEVREKVAASGQSSMSGDGVKVGSPRKQTADQKDLKAKPKKMDGICVVIEEVSQEHRSQEAESYKKQHVGTNQEQPTSAKDTGIPQSSPRRSAKKSPRGVPKTALAASPRSELPPEINSLGKEETKGGARIAIVEIEENDVTVNIRDKQKSLAHGNEGSTKAVEKANARGSIASPRSKQTTLKKGVIPSIRAYEHFEDNVAAVVTQRTSITDAGVPKRNGSNSPENPRSTSPQRLIAQLRTFMTQASLLNKLDLKSKILDCIGVNQVRDGYKIPANRGKIKTPTADVTHLKKVAAALKVGRKRLEDQSSSKILEEGKEVSIGMEESKKELLADVGVKSSIVVAEEARNKLISKGVSLRGGKHRERKSTTGSSCFSSSSDTPRPILVKDRARKRKVRNERKGVPRVRFSDTASGLTTSSSRQLHGSRRQRWASATPEIPARVKQVSPLRHAVGAGTTFPAGIVSSTMLALKRMHPPGTERSRPHSPSPSRRPSKQLPSAAATIMAVTMKAREIAKVPRQEAKSAAERRSRSPRTTSKAKRAAARESDRKRNWKSEQRTQEIVIRGLTAASATFPAEDRMDDIVRDFAPLQRPTKRRERSADDYDRTPIIPQMESELDKPISPRRLRTEKVSPTWHSSSYASGPTRKLSRSPTAAMRQSSRSPTADKSPALRLLHDNKRQVRTTTTVINSSPTQVPCSVAITKKTSVPSQSVKRTARKGAGTARAAIEHVVNIDIRMGSLAKDSTAAEETPTAKSSVVTKDSSVGTEEMQVLDVCIKALRAAGDEGESDEASVQTLMRAKELPKAGGGDVDDAGRDSSESMLALTELQSTGAGDRATDYSADADGEGEADEDSGEESDASSKTWPPATLVTPTTKTLTASFPRFSTASVPEEAARATAALERSLRLVSRACQSRPLECDLRWSAWMSALHAGDPDAAATPFPSSLSRSGRRDVDAALAAAVRVPALWLLAGLKAAELGARTVKLLHWLLVRLPAEGPALRALDPQDLKCPCKPSAAFKVRVCAGSALDARLRWRARGLPAFEAWASPSPCQLHALVCGGATTPVGVLSLTLAGALRRAQPGYGSGASRLGSRLRCVLKCDVAHHPELVERIGADAVVVRGLDLVRVRQLLVFSEPLPEGALAAWAARAIKKRRLAVAVAALLLTYLLVAAIVWTADLGIVGLSDAPQLPLARFLPWSEEPKPPATTNPQFSFWA